MIALLASIAMAPLPPLSIRGTDFIDPVGKPVVLRGVNLGGWLVEEIWMTPWVAKSADGRRQVRDSVSLWGEIRTRLGARATERVREAYRSNWIAEADFKRIRAAGLNSVRVPFLHDLLHERDGARWLQRAVDAAKANGLYVALDMHGLPGRQSMEHHTGQEGQNRLWSDPANVAEAERDWALVARRFAREPTVAAYDLMNEPMGAPNASTLYVVYDRIVRAVRRVDPKKPLIVEDGYKGADTFPFLASLGWGQVAYSVHFYQFEAKKTEDHLRILRERLPGLLGVQKSRGVPLYIGEFNLEPFNSPASMAAFVGEMDRAKWSWALWTYKVAPNSGSLGDWGLYRPSAPIDPPNPFSDSESTLVAKMSQLRTERFRAPAPLLAALAAPDK